MNKITIEWNVYVPELTKREHITYEYWTCGRKCDYCVQNALEWAMNEQGKTVPFVLKTQVED